MVIFYNCEICNKKGKRRYPNDKVPKHFFCSRPCQNEWQKSREDLILKNKDPEFRKKVSAGLKNRKKLLGDEYHSKETKKKIGNATLLHWKNYDQKTRDKILNILIENAQNLRTFKPYDIDWMKISRQLRSERRCERCDKDSKLAVHHIVPVKNNGSRDFENLAVLCMGCHMIIEKQTKNIFEILNDWDITATLVKTRLPKRRFYYGNEKYKTCGFKTTPEKSAQTSGSAD